MGLYILMLEDNDEDLMLLVHTLNQAGLDFEFTHVRHEEEYVQKISDQVPDIILSDFGIPGYSGLAALRHKREVGADCPFILVTGSLPDEVAVECIKAGADDYILKDRMRRLPDAIRQALDRKRAEEERRKAFSDLIKSQKRLEAAERMAKVGNWEWHPESDTVVWSDQMFALIEADRESFTPSIGVLADLMPPSDVEKWTADLPKLVNGTISTGDATFRLTTLEGTHKVVRCLFKTNGRATEPSELKVFGTMQDITDQFRTEKALRDLTEQLEQKVLERTGELLVTNKRLTSKNDELTDSINYARLIQRALLAKIEECSKLFQNSFVLWKPRDIVSGDFYWQYQDSRYSYIAAVDCTGHGVPGAMMSMIGHQMLNQTIIRKGMQEPEEILAELDRNVQQALADQTGTSGLRDGMDVILCRIDSAKREICFSGALRPLFLYSQGELMEYATSRHPIGNFIIENPEKDFAQLCISYTKGDTIYLTSDGYYSQFGGKDGKKMMKSRFKTLLANIGELSASEQYDKLNAYFKKWQGKEQQVDDVLVVGIQF